MPKLPYTTNVSFNINIMRFLRSLLNVPLIEFIIRLLILCFCFVLVTLILGFVGISNPGTIGVPVLITFIVFFSQLILRFCQIKAESQLTYLGLSISNVAIKNFLKGVALVFVVGVMALFLELLLGWVRFDGFIWQSSSWGIIKIGLISILLVICRQLSAGWWEELLFRGYLIQIPGTKNGFVLSAIASSLIFGISHHLVPPNIPLEVVPIDIAIGLLLAYCYMKNGLWFTIGLHVALNTIPNSLFGLTNSGISIIKLTYHFPNWTIISGTLIQPWLLLFLFILVMFFVQSKSDYIISSDSIAI